MKCKILKKFLKEFHVDYQVGFEVGTIENHITISLHLFDVSTNCSIKRATGTKGSVNSSQGGSIVSISRFLLC